MLSISGDRVAMKLQSEEWCHRASAFDILDCGTGEGCPFCNIQESESCLAAADGRKLLLQQLHPGNLLELAPGKVQELRHLQHQQDRYILVENICRQAPLRENVSIEKLGLS